MAFPSCVMAHRRDTAFFKPPLTIVMSMGRDIRLRTAATRRAIVHPLGDM
jgi:hypothetical protein